MEDLPPTLSFISPECFSLLLLHSFSFIVVFLLARLMLTACLCLLTFYYISLFSVSLFYTTFPRLPCNSVTSFISASSSSLFSIDHHSPCPTSLFTPLSISFYLLLTSNFSLPSSPNHFLCPPPPHPTNPHNHPSLLFPLCFLETHFSQFLSTDTDLSIPFFSSPSLSCCCSV